MIILEWLYMYIIIRCKIIGGANMKGILGKKLGMTQIFTAEGIVVPVTVVEATPNVVTQIKTVEKRIQCNTSRFLKMLKKNL